MTKELKQKIFLNLLEVDPNNIIFKHPADKVEWATRTLEKLLKAFDDAFCGHGNGD